MLLLTSVLKELGLNTPQKETKIHFAKIPGTTEHLDAFTRGNFDYFQNHQNKRNFQRKYIISLIALEGNKWLFAGVYKVSGEPREYFCEIDKKKRFLYNTKKISTKGVGRIIVSYKKTARSMYRYAETLVDKLKVGEIYPEPYKVESFKGFKNINLSYDDLSYIIKNNIQSWRGALESVAGIYLISDKKTGKLYVGKADGEGGFWQRWTDYALSKHGGNKDLLSLLKEDPEAYKHFCYSILEILDTHSGIEEVFTREQHWMNVLNSKKFGHNN